MVGWTYTPLKARNGPWRGYACETTESEQDSGQTGGQVVCRAAAIWAPSNPLKAKVVGWGWKLWPCEALGSTVGHAAKPSSEAFGLGWMDLMGLGWIEVLIWLQKHRAGLHSLPLFLKVKLWLCPSRSPPPRAWARGRRIFTPIRGRFPFWLIFFKSVGSTTI